MYLSSSLVPGFIPLGPGSHLGQRAAAEVVQSAAHEAPQAVERPIVQ
jgi:hypothetical protein